MKNPDVSTTSRTPAGSPAAGEEPVAVTVIDVTTDGELDQIRQLFREYHAAFIDEPLFDRCIARQDFEGELARLPGEYAPPRGALFLAVVGEAPAGCIAVRYLGDGLCEMKRLFVRPEHRGRHVGQRLVARLLERARELGYEYMRLDTLPTMTGAHALYRSFGFHECEPYGVSAGDAAVFMEIDLANGR
jgi:putative acetyltransferase